MGAPGAVNIHTFAWKLSSAIYKFHSFIHSFPCQSVSLSFSLCLFKEKYTLCLLCKTVGPSSASHRHDDVISTTLTACHRLIVVLSGQLPDEDGVKQTSIGPVTTAVRGPTNTAVSVGDRPDESLLPALVVIPLD